MDPFARDLYKAFRIGRRRLIRPAKNEFPGSLSRRQIFGLAGNRAVEIEDVLATANQTAEGTAGSTNHKRLAKYVWGPRTGPFAEAYLTRGVLHALEGSRRLES